MTYVTNDKCAVQSIIKPGMKVFQPDNKIKNKV
jgi:hypothetical protein